MLILIAYANAVLAVYVWQRMARLYVPLTSTTDRLNCRKSLGELVNKPYDLDLFSPSEIHFNEHHVTQSMESDQEVSFRIQVSQLRHWREPLHRCFLGIQSTLPSARSVVKGHSLKERVCQERKAFRRCKRECQCCRRKGLR